MQSVLLFDFTVVHVKTKYNNNIKHRRNYTRQKGKLIITFVVTFIVKQDGFRTTVLGSGKEEKDFFSIFIGRN